MPGLQELSDVSSSFSQSLITKFFKLLSTKSNYYSPCSRQTMHFEEIWIVNTRRQSSYIIAKQILWPKLARNRHLLTIHNCTLYFSRSAVTKGND